MTYELAKELKEAGFPQRCCSFIDCRHGMDKGIECVYKPHLSELIEACGRDFGGLYRSRVPEPTWEASGYERDDFHFLADTPEEAVAYLWFALNANKDKGFNQ